MLLLRAAALWRCIKGLNRYVVSEAEAFEIWAGDIFENRRLKNRQFDRRCAGGRSQAGARIARTGSTIDGLPKELAV
jgi:hypothetical protein